MKKLLLLVIPAAILFLSACDSNNNPTTPANTKGNLFVSSNPAGAQIWLDGVNTNQVTPDTVLQKGYRGAHLKCVKNIPM